MDMELCICCYYCGEFEIAIKAFKRIFDNIDKIPNNLLQLTASNLRFYISKIDSNDEKFYVGFKKFKNICMEKNIKITEEEKIENLFKNNNKSYFIK